MRRRAMLSLAIAGMFILASAAVTQANWYHKSEGSGGSTSEMTSPSGEPGTEAPEVGTYEQQQPSEAGKLPAGESAKGSINEFPGDTGFQSLKYGGARVSADIDTGP